MQIVVLANALQKEELSKNEAPGNVVWIAKETEFLQYKEAGAFIDLQFMNTNGRNEILQQLLPKTVIVNSVVETLNELHPSFVRINGWNTFLSSFLIEASCINERLKPDVDEVFSFLNKKIEWLPDEPGFVTARVVSMIVNEAFLALAEGVSTKEEINTAMKLGTAYPYGPFEWAEKIGLENIVALLKKLSNTNGRYEPCALLAKEG